MKKIITLLLACALLFPVHMLFWSYMWKTITIWNSSYSYISVYKMLDRSLDKKSQWDIFKKYEFYKKLRNYTLREYNQTNDIFYKQVSEVLELGTNMVKNELMITVQKVEIWVSEEWRKIYAYLKWNPEQSYKLLVANIHGWYEYGTYETAQKLIQKLETHDASSWIIIPTLNPDGLQEYFEKGNYLNAYFDSRDNSNGVDLNRNFCSKNFVLGESEKYGKIMKTWIGGCESEKETQTFVSFLEDFSISHVISLHSAWKIFYIPDGSIDDTKQIEFTQEVHKLLPDYEFSVDTSTPEKRRLSILRYEIDEWWSQLYTGTLETYVYEKYNIPVVLIELTSHWVIESRLENIFDLKF